MIEYFLRLLDCGQQYTFDMIVDLKQRPIGTLLNNEISDGNHKFLWVTKVPTLSKNAISRENSSGHSRLYEIQNEDKKVANIVDYEKITYLVSSENSYKGTLISFQEGKPDDTFEQVRDSLNSKWNKEIIHTRGPAYLLLQLIKASTISTVHVENYLNMCLDELEKDFQESPNNLKLLNFARNIDEECGEMLSFLQPFGDTLDDISSGQFGIELLGINGRNKPAWTSKAIQVHRIYDDILSIQYRAKSIVQSYYDLQSKREEEIQKQMAVNQNIMSIVLSVFAPLSFITAVYGMNFHESDGSPGIPELTWGWVPSDPNDPASAPERNGLTGYQYFWILIGSLTALTILVYMFLGLIYNPFECYTYMLRPLFFSKRQDKKY